jgi:hypothetical protein
VLRLRSASRRIAEALLERAPLVGRDERLPKQPSPRRLVVNEAAQLLEGAVEPNDPAFRVHSAEERGSRVDDGAEKIPLPLKLVGADFELVVQLPELVVRPLPLGDVADDDHGLVVAGRDDPCLRVPEAHRSLHAVLDRLHVAGVEGTRDRIANQVGDRCREHVVDRRAGEL